MDFYIQIGFTVLFQLLKDKKQMAKFKPALRKLYINLHASRLVFLEPGDLELLGEIRAKE